MSAPRTTCAECGYDLAGAGPAPAQARCPECGTEFDPRQPWTVRAWPAWRRTVWRMCRGTVWMGVSTWVLIIGASHLLEAAAALAVPLVIFCWLFAIIWPPTETARDLTNTCMPKRGRERRRLAMSLGGIGLNVFLFLAWLVITGVFAGLLSSEDTATTEGVPVGERRSAVAIPIAFTVLRLALGPAMIAAALASGEAARPWLAATLCIGMASDFADGITARTLRVQSVALRRFDSRTDLVFWACALGCVWVLSPGVMRELWWVVAALVALHAVATGVDRRRGGGTLAVRSYAAKAMGVPVFAAVLALLWTGRAGWIVWFTAAWVSAAEIDVVLIALLLPGWEGNVPSAWSAWRKRRALDRQRDGGAAR